MPPSPETGERTSERDRSSNGLPTSRCEEGPNASSVREHSLSPTTKPGPRRGKKPMEGERAIGFNNRLTRRTSNEEQSLEAGSSSGPDLMALTGNGRARGPWSRSSKTTRLAGWHNAADLTVQRLGGVPSGSQEAPGDRFRLGLYRASARQIGTPTLHHLERGLASQRASMLRAGPKNRNEAVDSRATALERRRETAGGCPTGAAVGENDAGHKCFDSSDASLPAAKREAK
jgi:hypothetical protein